MPWQITRPTRARRSVCVRLQDDGQRNAAMGQVLTGGQPDNEARYMKAQRAIAGDVNVVFGVVLGNQRVTAVTDRICALTDVGPARALNGRGQNTSLDFCQDHTGDIPSHALSLRGLRFPLNTEQRIHQRPTLAHFAVSHLSLHGDRFLTLPRRRLDIGDREIRRSRDAGSAQRALLEQQPRQNNCFLWWRRLRHRRRNRNRIVAISSLGQTPRANSGEDSDEAAVHGVAVVAFREFAKRYFHGKRWLEPRDPTRESEIVEWRCAPLASSLEKLFSGPQA